MNEIGERNKMTWENAKYASDVLEMCGIDRVTDTRKLYTHGIGDTNLFSYVFETKNDKIDIVQLFTGPNKLMAPAASLYGEVELHFNDFYQRFTFTAWGRRTALADTPLGRRMGGTLQFFLSDVKSIVYTKETKPYHPRDKTYHKWLIFLNSGVFFEVRTYAN